MMAEKKKKPIDPCAPYNFVPLAEDVILRYEHEDVLPPHNEWDENLLTGEIVLTVTAKTPIYISNGKKNDKADFIRNINGNYIIPGSSLRGLIRSNMQILGLGLLRKKTDFQDIYLFYREMASAEDSARADLKKQYRETLGIVKGENGESDEPPKVMAGYLRCEGRNYSIIPLADPVLKIKRNSRLAQKKSSYKKDKNRQFMSWSDCYAFTENVWYKANGNEVAELFNSWEYKKLHRTDLQKGVLMGNGYMDKQNILYLFPEEKKFGRQIPIRKENIISYREDWEARKRQLSGQTGNDKNFWALPGNGHSKPVFYLMKNGKPYFGMSPYLRLYYDFSLGHGLPEQHKALQGQTVLDYPNAIMGYAEGKTAYRSRVSFGDLQVITAAKTQDSVLVIPGEPKPTFFEAYSTEGKSYNEKDFRLRGIKQYWMKDAEIPRYQKINPNTASTLLPLPTGTSFTGTIRYKNLHPDELGLLLWCLKLDDGCEQEYYQNIGMGKPYGYGRIKIHVDALKEYDPTTLYNSLELPKIDTSRTSERVQELIEDEYLTYAAAKLNRQTLRTLPHIQDFMFMKRTIRTDKKNVSYIPSPGQHRNLTKVLETVTEVKYRMEDSEETQ